MLDRSSAHPTDPVTLPGISRTLDCEGKSKLFEHGAQRQWARHQMLFAAGKPIKSLHRVASGVLARSIALPKGRRQIVDFLFTGDICNLVQSDGTHMFDCEAITDATTCAVDASVLRKFTGASVAIGKALEEEVLRALNRTAEQLVTVGKFSAAERLLRFLHLLEEAYAERGLPTRPLALPMTRSDIGDYLGMQLETVCRAFAKLKARDLVGSVSAEHVVLHRRKAASLAHGKTPAVSALV